MEYKGRIILDKEKMFYILNDKFNCNLKKTTTKEEMVKLVGSVYESADDEYLIKIIPYYVYKILEKIIKMYKENKSSDDIYNMLNKSTTVEDINCMITLQLLMVVVVRAKGGKYPVEINEGAIKALEKLYTKENKKLAEKYGEIERLIFGMVNSYGVVKMDYFIDKINYYTEGKYTEEEILNFCEERLNLYDLVFDIIVFDEEDGESLRFITNISEEVYGSAILLEGLDSRVFNIIEEQRSKKFNYKEFTKEEILNREEILDNKFTKNFIKFLAKITNNVDVTGLKLLFSYNELGVDVIGMFNDIYGSRVINTDFEDSFLEELMIWHNNSPKYTLCGYSPEELRKK